MLLGLRTALYTVPDVESGKAWYTDAIGHGPYFDQPFYVGYNVGGYELGLVPADEKHTPGGSGAMVYWGVDNAEAALASLLEKGATVHEALADVGEGILVATVLDPFGNVFGVIENPHFKLPEAGEAA
ncbi:MAG TPA: VOC family protein [Rhodothermales bacterium]|nr:VOC family protein [Rhodothermales bacterium]